MVVVEVGVSKLPIKANGIGKIRYTKREYRVNARIAGKINIDPFGKEFWISSAEAYGREAGGKGTTTIITSANGNPMKPYNIVRQRNGLVAFFGGKSFWECSYAFIDRDVSLKTFRYHHVTDLETIFLRSMPDAGMALLAEWIKRHNSKHGVMRIPIPKFPSSEDTWQAIDMLICTQTMLVEGQFLREGPPNARDIVQILEDKALSTPDIIMHADMRHYTLCECGKWLKKGLKCNKCAVKKEAPEEEKKKEEIPVKEAEGEL